ncbi:MAG: glycoside hydrolase family 16 protein [Bacteroidetes bacterium]|nr:glycoside hydrolase family 16 protein [Bacteroidota bacterium]
MNKLFLISFILFASFLFCYGQIPVNDPAWTLQSSVSDDFTGTSLNASKWTKVGDSIPGHGLEMMYYRNVTVAGGRLKIKADTLLWNAPYTGGAYTPYHYQSGEIISQSTYKYGYIEINAKFPTGNKLYWPAFWYWNSYCAGNGWYEEVDICENGETESFDQHSMGTNFHIQYTPNCGTDLTRGVSITGLPQLNQAYHKYALQWNPGGVYFYFDDSLVRPPNPSLDPPVPSHALMVDLDFYVNPWVSPRPAFTSDSLVVDYVRYYTLNTAGCLTDKTICTPATDYSTRGVYKTITAGGVSCTPTFNTSNQYTLRATDSVLLDQGTLINSDGSGQFSIIIEPCSN